MTKRILKISEVTHSTGLGRSTLYERVKEGKFPRPVHLGPRAVGWLEEEVLGWIDARAAERDCEVAP